MLILNTFFYLLTCIETTGSPPADAGTTSMNSMSVAIGKDHPRGCGDYKRTLKEVIDEYGSPPRMRGLRFDDVVHVELKRITPADAGTTSNPSFLSEV